MRAVVWLQEKVKREKVGRNVMDLGTCIYTTSTTSLWKSAFIYTKSAQSYYLIMKRSFLTDCPYRGMDASARKA